MSKKSDIDPKTIILGISIILTIGLGLTHLIIFPHLISWCLGYGTYYLLSTFK